MALGKLSRGVWSSLVLSVSCEGVWTTEDWLCPGGGRRKSLLGGCCSSVTCVSLPHSGKSAQEGRRGRREEKGGEREKGRGRRGEGGGEKKEEGGSLHRVPLQFSTYLQVEVPGGHFQLRGRESPRHGRWATSSGGQRSESWGEEKGEV